MSDENAVIYYLARLIDTGKSADFIARRMAIFASEDIGNANPPKSAAAAETPKAEEAPAATAEAPKADAAPASEAPKADAAPAEKPAEGTAEAPKADAAPEA